MLGSESVKTKILAVFFYSTIQNIHYFPSSKWKCQKHSCCRYLVVFCQINERKILHFELVNYHESFCKGLLLAKLSQLQLAQGPNIHGDYTIGSTVLKRHLIFGIHSSAYKSSALTILDTQLFEVNRAESTCI